MPSLTAAERRERVADDDGDPEETVYRLRNTGRCDLVYHEATDCPDLRIDDPVEMTRGECQDRDIPPCSKCVLGWGKQKGKAEQSPALRNRLDDVDYEFEWDRRADDADGEEVA